MRYIFVKQHDSTDCAAACLAMVCLYYKKSITISKLRDLMGTDIKGTNLIGLSQCADSLGFASRAVRVDKKGLRSRYTLPCIANVKTDGGYSHFVVIFKVNRRSLVIGDPGRDLQRIRIDTFCENFLGSLLILKPDDRFVPGKEKSGGIIRQYLNILLPQKKLFACSILASLLLTALGLLSSLFNKIVMDEILPYKLEEPFKILLLMFILLSATQLAVGFIRQWMMIYLSQKLNIPLILNYFRHIYNLPLKFFASRKTGDIMTRFSDATVIMNILTNITISLVLDIGMAIIMGSILFFMNIRLFGIIIVITMINILLVFIFKEPYKRINEEQMQQSSRLNSQIIEGLRAVETIKVNCYEEKEMETLENNYIRLLRTEFKEGMFSNVQGIISGVASAIGNLVLMYVGMMQVMNSEITLGTFMAFSTISGSFMGPVNKLVSLQMQIQEANISLKRLSEIMDYKPEQDTEEFLSDEADWDSKTAVEFQNVTFRYGNREPALSDVSFRIEKNQKVEIIGESGSGKSTIAKLLLKYDTPESGRILFCGKSIEDYKNDFVRKSISYVPQSIELFSRSILDNIRLGRPDAALGEVKDAAKAARADEFIDRLPLQYFTCLEETGNGLSGGEKQRLVLARALLKKNSIYILDECTSHLDFKTEKGIFDFLYGHLKEETVIVIAHRLAAVRNCDWIYVMDHGKIAEQGTHDSLLKEQGIYRDLWEMQQGSTENKR